MKNNPTLPSKTEVDCFIKEFEQFVDLFCEDSSILDDEQMATFGQCVTVIMKKAMESNNHETN